MLIDTDVLSWYLRGNPKSYDLIENLNQFYISMVSYVELVQGMRNKEELVLFKKTIRN